MAFQSLADLQNLAIGWLQRGYSSVGGGTVVQFPRFWMSSGECRVISVVLLQLLGLGIVFSSVNSQLGYLKKLTRIEVVRFKCV